ncbi:hypothetical protein EYC80_007018 [Monilinia laxa]|uniref:Uncharacterized protein n=1 Tax=Monilinia laxa TaxID=61186 RepID=A0A5N6K040_MONLA|nr:hypothetical protein EYC80_007018 [Monilinia laxa]
MKFSTVLLSVLVAGIHSFPNRAVPRESAGITVGADGSTNLGGEAGITKKPNGSTSVGGESGINTSGGAIGEPQKAAGGQTGQDGNKSGTDGLAALIGALNGASGGKGNSTSGGAKATGIGGKKPKGTGNANANLPPGVASNSSLASVFGALEGAK